MRVMARITVPVESGNRAIQEGRIGPVLQQVAERWNPEAMYFATFDGQRSAFIVFDLPDPSDLPTFAEPLFNGFDANVAITPAMNAEDMQKGLSRLGTPPPG